MLFRLFKSHLESRAFVFLHTDGHAATIGVEVEHAVQPVGRDDERAAERAVFIGGEIGRGNLLPVGIAERNLFRVFVHKAQVLTLATGHDALEIDGLTGTVNGAVGEEFRFVHLVVVSVLLIEAEVPFWKQVVITFAQVDAEGIIAFHLVVKHDATIFVGFHRGKDDGLVLSGFVVPFAAVELHGDPFHGFPRFAVNSHHSHFFVFLVNDVTEVGDLEIEYQRFILALDALFGGGSQVVDAFLQGR